MAVTKEYAWKESDDLPGGKGASFKTVQDWLDFMDVTGYYGYYGLPQEPGWTDPEITAKKAQMEKEREAKESLKKFSESEDVPDVTTQSLTGEDLDDPSSGAFKHGGRIKKKKRKKKGRPRGVGKALRGYGKAMKHGK